MMRASMLTVRWIGLLVASFTTLLCVSTARMAHRRCAALCSELSRVGGTNKGDAARSHSVSNSAERVCRMVITISLAFTILVTVAASLWVSLTATAQSQEAPRICSASKV
ncbi:hypothetical protein EMPG_13986 [Blastomyces silverae]|uniref:Uncharacterized protein n=1 Tax=Blastomyces silverae TaxID=2060906 RepID=A0A0H1BH00_9EURO|nr:hypothetical protein EMPG_13986 [Blastomyces silverae]